MTDGLAVKRFVQAAARLDPALARWISAAVWRGLPPVRRRRIRDELLREAARGLTSGSAWEKARLIAELARCPGKPDASTVPGLVALAVRSYQGRGGLSARQVLRILFDKTGLAMTAPAVATWDLDIL